MAQPRDPGPTRSLVGAFSQLSYGEPNEREPQAWDRKISLITRTSRCTRARARLARIPGLDEVICGYNT
jgi:hypothetical protein